MSTGRSCDGYPESAHSRPSDSAISSYAIPYRVPGSQEDRQILHYYVVHASSSFSGYLASEFWHRIVLQQSQSNHVVRNAVLALGALHRDYMTEPEEGRVQSTYDGASEKTLLLYNRAMRSLRLFLESGETSKQRRGWSTNDYDPIITALVCSALFYSFESSRGLGEAALQHLRNGVAILQRPQDISLAQSPHVATDHDVMRELTNLFVRLDLQGTLYDDDRVPLMDLTEQNMDESGCSTSGTGSTPFSTLTEAHTALTAIQNRLFRLLVLNVGHQFDNPEEFPPAILAEKSALLDDFAAWHQRLGIIRQPQSSESEPHGVELRSYSLGSSILVLHARTCNLLLCSKFPNDPTAFGGGTAPASLAATERVRECLDLATVILESDADPAQQSPPAIERGWRRRHLSAELGVVAPLYVIAMKSSDASVVRRALCLLTAAENRREGLYDSSVVRGIVEKALALEVRDEELESLSLERLDISTVPAEYRGVHIQDKRSGGLNGFAKLMGETV